MFQGLTVRTVRLKFDRTNNVSRPTGAEALKLVLGPANSSGIPTAKRVSDASPHCVCLSPQAPRPLSKVLAEQTDPPDPSTSLPLRYYSRSARNTLRQVAYYRREGDERSLYVLLMRTAGLIIDTIPAHPGYKDKVRTRNFIFFHREGEMALKVCQGRQESS